MLRCTCRKCDSRQQSGSRKLKSAKRCTSVFAGENQAGEYAYQTILDALHKGLKG